MAVKAAILAAGKGTRFGADKTAIQLRGKPLWRHSFDTFLNHPEIDSVGLICAPEATEDLRKQAPEADFIEPGGETRQESTQAAVIAAKPAEILLIHDAARPFVSGDLISKVIEAIRQKGAAAPAIKVTDTIRELGVQPGDLRDVDRNRLIAMQTPQGARLDIFETAFAKAREIYTDDVALFQNAGIATEIVQGDKRNIKITTPEDLAFTTGLLGGPERRTGMGYDVHPFSKEAGRKLYLGGVLFEDAQGLEGHSDADVLLHAVVDALLGAAAFGDIGQHFPNTDPQWKNRESLYFLEQTGRILGEGGWRIVNIDATIIAEIPKVMPKAEAIRASISQSLNIEPHRVSIKATTNERLGAIGRGEGIAAFAVATISESA